MNHDIMKDSAENRIAETDGTSLKESVAVSEDMTAESPGTIDNKKSNKKKIKKILKYVFIVLVLIFLGRYFYRNREDYAKLDVKINWWVFSAAVVMHFIYKIMQASLWHYITILNDCSIKWFNAVVAYLYSILGKYIPGKVFMLLARIPAYEEEGKSIGKVSVSFLIENVCTLLGAAFLFLLSLIFIPADVLADFGKYKWATLLLVVIFFVCINPKIINFFLGILQKITKKDNLKIPITYPQMIKVVVLFILNWIVLGIGFYMVAYSIHVIPISEMLYVAGVFGLSVIIGILAIFAPSGLGVREGILVLGLSFIIPKEYAVIISIVSRLWMTVSELSVIGLGFVADKVHKHRIKQK